MQYGKLVNGILTYAPKVLRIGPLVVVNPSPEQLLAAGYLPIVDEPPVVEEGYYAVPAGWEEQDGAICRIYTIEKIPEPTHTYKKSFLAQWLYANGKWETLLELLENSDDAKFYWETSTEFDSTHPLWGEISAGVKLGLGMDDDEFARFLTAGETGNIQA